MNPDLSVMLAAMAMFPPVPGEPGYAPHRATAPDPVAPVSGVERLLRAATKRARRAERLRRTLAPVEVAR